MEKKVGYYSKILLSFFLIFFLISSVSATLKTLNSDDEDSTYFTFSNDFVKVVSDNNNSAAEIFFEVNGNLKNVSYSLESCGNETYCVNFFLKNILQIAGGSFVNSTQFEVNVNSQKKNIWLDLDNPIINVTKSELNIETSKIDFEFTSFDETGNISKIEMYKKTGNDLVYIKDLTGKNNYSYSISEAGNFTFLFKVYDGALNSYESEIDVYFPDIFKPKIEKTKLIFEEGKYELSFKITDEELAKYEILQGALILSEDITGSSLEKTINIPFSTGDIVFRVTDNQTNTVNKTVTLTSPITSINYNKYSNDRYFKFRTNAQNCYLTKVGLKTYNNLKFNKNGDVFSYDLDVDEVKNYEVGFYCELNDFTQYFIEDFYYDTNEPYILSNLSVEQTNLGDLKLKWDESMDRESEVEYILYRDGEKVYDGSKLKYLDDDVDYTKEYEYYLVIRDEAGNDIETDKVSATPKKVDVNFDTVMKDNVQVRDEVFNIEFETDKNSDVDIVVKNSNQIIYKKSFVGIKTSKVKTSFNLSEGVNTIIVNVEDEFGNDVVKTFFVTYEKEVLAQKVVEDSNVLNSNEEVVKNKVEEPKKGNQSVVENSEKVSDLSDWFWPIVFVVFFVLFVWILIFNEKTKLDRRKKPKVQKKMYTTKNQKKKLSFLSVHRFKDNLLEKDFNRIKKNRLNRDIEKRKEIERAKKRESKVLSKFDKQKLKNLSVKRDVFVPFKKRVQAKRRVEKIKKNTEYKKEGRMPLRKRDAKKDDEFANYIARVKSAPSWSSTRDYVAPKHKQSSKEESLEKDLEKASDQKKAKLSFWRRAKIVESSVDEEEKKVEIAEKVEKKDSVVAEKLDKRHLDDYLNKRFKNKNKRSFYFAEREVDRDLRR